MWSIAGNQYVTAYVYVVTVVGGVGDGGDGCTSGGGGSDNGCGAVGHTGVAAHGDVVLRWWDGWCRPAAAILPAAVAAYTIAWW